MKKLSASLSVLILIFVFSSGATAAEGETLVTVVNPAVCNPDKGPATLSAQPIATPMAIVQDGDDSASQNVSNTWRSAPFDTSSCARLRISGRALGSTKFQSINVYDESLAWEDHSRPPVKKWIPNPIASKVGYFFDFVLETPPPSIQVDIVMTDTVDENFVLGVYCL
jgi:hypothetical protein